MGFWVPRSLDESSAADVAWVPAAKSVAESAGPREGSAPQRRKKASLMKNA